MVIAVMLANTLPFDYTKKSRKLEPDTLLLLPKLTHKCQMLGRGRSVVNVMYRLYAHCGLSTKTVSVNSTLKLEIFQIPVRAYSFASNEP
jgi:hypothetical protein